MRSAIAVTALVIGLAGGAQAQNGARSTVGMWSVAPSEDHTFLMAMEIGNARVSYFQLREPEDQFDQFIAITIEPCDADNSGAVGYEFSVFPIEETREERVAAMRSEMDPLLANARMACDLPDDFEAAVLADFDAAFTATEPYRVEFAFEDDEYDADVDPDMEEAEEAMEEAAAE